jgi:Putative transposase
MEWKNPPRRGFFLPVRVLSRVFRGKFVAGLKRLFRRRQLQFHGALRSFAGAKRFHHFQRSLFQSDWVVYAKRPFGGPEHVLQYLARYTHRVAISNHRLLSFAEGQVTFRWKDYAHGSKQRKMTLTTDEFLRRFLLHVLPGGFVRLRHFGFLANRQRGEHIARCRQLLTSQNPLNSSAPVPARPVPVRRVCPLCAGRMEILERLTAQQITFRRVGGQSFVDTS